MALEQSKQCCKCKTVKAYSDFNKNRSKKDGYANECRDCQNAYKAANRERDCQKAKEWRLNNIDRSNNNRLKREYGITVEDFNRMFESQNGVCAICKKPETENKTLAVDHCHTTDKVRALLCGKCNKAIGLLNDDTDLLRVAIAYLEQYKFGNN